MKLSDMIHRQIPPEPWAEGEKIPWNDPDFSRRMLKEHLTQTHDAASRRFETIDKHVIWIHEHVLKGEPSRILDLGCGPGLYTQRLAQRGHSCVGIDFSPASIEYARQQAEESGLNCTYVQDDIRTADFGEGFGLVMSIFGEFNVFRPEEAKSILQKANHALLPGGFLLLEPHTFDKVAELGQAPPSWYVAEGGLFSEKPHIHLHENFWDEEQKVTIERYYIIDAAKGGVTFHSSSMQAYTDEEYRAMLVEAGFGSVEIFPAFGGVNSPQAGLMVVLAQK